MYLGILDTSGEAIVGTPGGVLRARSLKRLPEDKRWDSSAIVGTYGSPWAPTGREPKPIGIMIDMGDDTGREMPPPLLRETPLVRRTFLKKSDFEKYVFAEGCLGCKALVRGDARAANHRDSCRARIEAAMSSTPDGATRIRRAETRITDAMAEYLTKKFKPNVEAPASGPVDEAGGDAIVTDFRPEVVIHAEGGTVDVTSAADVPIPNDDDMEEDDGAGT